MTPRSGRAATRLSSSKSGPLAMLIALVGCAHHQPPATQSTRATTQPDYWLAQPSHATVVASDFQQSWNAAEETARQYGFTIDREDYRSGLLTTRPLTSKQFFEFWRSDTQSGEDLAKSSLATYRRTVRFQFRKLDNGRYEVAPTVLIERFARAEQPITASVYLRNALRSTRGARYQRSGTPESDRGIYLPRYYWYPTGRDEVVEQDMARSIARKLGT